MLEGVWRKGNPLPLLVGMQVSAATLENSVEIPQEIKNRASLGPCNCTPRYLPQGYRWSEKKGHLYPNVYSSNGHSHQTVERTKMPFTDEWIRKIWSIYTMEYYASIRKDEYPTFVATWMGLEEIMLSEISQAERVHYHMVSLICGA